MPRDRISESVAWNAGVALQPVERNGEGPGTAHQEGPDSQDGLGIGSGARTRGQDLEGVLAVGENSSIEEAVDRRTLKQNLEAEADGKHLAQAVSAMTESGAETNA